ncbi:hypothetical protein [Carnobacterium sp.]|uniref:hypothetical protein n=1 Tax=Carnobacterium sp. TaxID=48221 RepID=UPI003C735F3C
MKLKKLFISIICGIMLVGIIAPTVKVSANEYLDQESVNIDIEGIENNFSDETEQEEKERINLAIAETMNNHPEASESDLRALAEYYVALDKGEVTPNEMAQLRAAAMRLKTSTVGTGLDIAISLAFGGAASAGIKAMLKKHGVKFVKDRLYKIVVQKLAIFGVKKVSGITVIINTIVKNVLQPGMQIANWLDKKSDSKKDGYITI